MMLWFSAKINAVFLNEGVGVKLPSCRDLNVGQTHWDAKSPVNIASKPHRTKSQN